MGRSQADVAATALVAVLACGAAASGAPPAAMIVLGIMLMAAPGYLLGQLLVGSRIAGLERVAVMTGLALAVPVLGGLLLYAAGVPLHRPGWLGLLAGVTLAADTALFARRRAAAPAPGRPRPAWRLSPGHVAVFAVAVLVAAAAVGLAVVGVARQPQPGFTQLWLSPQRPDAHTLSLGVTNDQGRTTSYRLVLQRDGRVTGTWNLTLGEGRTWRRSVPFTGKQTLAARLYRLPDLSHPYRYVSADPSSGAAGP
jgi:uncharacterized membrane protein